MEYSCDPVQNASWPAESELGYRFNGMRYPEQERNK